MMNPKGGAKRKLATAGTRRRYANPLTWYIPIAAAVRLQRRGTKFLVHFMENLMKKLALTLMAIAMISACSEEQREEVTATTGEMAESIEANMDSAAEAIEDAAADA